MSDDVNAEILGVVGSLLRQADRTGADVWGWSQKGVGPKAYVERVMRRADVVFAIWEDDAAVGGYAFCVVSGSVAPAPKGGRRVEATFRVPNRSSALYLASDFGNARKPAPWEPWNISLMIPDPDRELDERGRPAMMMIMDINP